MRIFTNPGWNNLSRFSKRKKLQSNPVYRIGRKRRASQAFNNAAARDMPIKKARGDVAENSEDSKSSAKGSEENDADDDESTGGSRSGQGDCGRSGDSDGGNGGSDVDDDAGDSSGRENDDEHIGSSGNEQGSGGGSNDNAQEVVQTIVPPMICECRNCHREKNPSLRTLPATIDIQHVPLSSLSLRRKWCTFRLAELNGNATCAICNECKVYLTSDNPGDPNDWRCIWPAYVWSVMADASVVSAIGAEAVWRLVPAAWRPWWINPVKEAFASFDIAEVSMDSPSSVFVDVTEARDEYLDMRKSLKLANIIDVVNRRLKATVLCPWGCSEFAHECGTLPLDTVFQSFVPEVKLPTTTVGMASLKKIKSARRDYFSEDKEMLLLCPDMEVSPSVAFVDGKGMSVLTCSDHDGGTTDAYFHIPKSFNRLPSMMSDQLAPVVIQNRTFKTMMAKSYNTTHQMSSQVGGFGGLDTCSVRSHGRFDFHSHVLSVSESISIAGRKDIASMLDRLASEGRITSESVYNMKELSNKRHGGTLDISRKKCLEGATFMSYLDAIKIQHEVSTPNEIRVVSSRMVDGVAVESESLFEPNWVRSLLWIHNPDEYGAQMNSTPNLNKERSRREQNADYRLIWCLSSVCTNIPEVWKILSENVVRDTQWTGFFLTFVSKFVMCACSKSVAKNDVFKTARMWKPRIVLEKMGETRTSARKKLAITEGVLRQSYHNSHYKQYDPFNGNL